MRTIILQELKCYSFEELINLFSLTENDFYPILDFLILNNVVKTANSSLKDINIEELGENNNLDLFSLENIYIFKFVGIFYICNLCLFVYPKYLDSYKEDLNFKKFKQIIKVINKYNGKKISQNLGYSNNSKKFNVISLAKDLIEDYNENGLFFSSVNTMEINRPGEILWEQTINTTEPLIISGTSYYFNLITTNTITNNLDFFRILHSIVLTMISVECQELLNFLDIPTLNINNSSLDSLGSFDFIISKIDLELSRQFITRNIKVLNLVKSYLLKINTSNPFYNISFVGTTSFNMVWEDVCSITMSNCKNKSLKELNLHYSDAVNDSILLSNIIPKPQWTYLSIDGKMYTHEANKTLTPDIIIVDSSNHTFSIYDAKYYKIKLDGHSVSKQPGVADIDKQFLYELAYKKLASENNLIIDRNAFLLPSEKPCEEIIGFATIKIFSHLDNCCFKNIELILKPCEELFNIYLKK